MAKWLNRYFEIESRRDRSRTSSGRSSELISLSTPEKRSTSNRRTEPATGPSRPPTGAGLNCTPGNNPRPAYSTAAGQPCPMDSCVRAEMPPVIATDASIITLQSQSPGRVLSTTLKRFAESNWLAGSVIKSIQGQVRFVLSVCATGARSAFC